jgi:hypothetical protein
MPSKFSYNPWEVSDLVTGVDKGTIRLPDIQRPFVWSNSKVRDLIDSMYRGYPVGELMFWKNADQDHTRSIGDAHAKTQDISFQVVDGQQRLTSLYAVVKGLTVWRGDYTREKVVISFNPLTERFEVPNAATRRSSEWIDDITEIFKDSFAARDAYLGALRKDPRIAVDRELERRVERVLRDVDDLQKYEFTVVQIKEEVERETVADIFVRINSEGQSLTASDFILTWLSVFWEEGRTELENWARNSRFTPQTLATALDEHVDWTPINPYLDFDAGQILRVAVAVGLKRARLQDAYNYLRGRDPRTRMIDPAMRETALTQLKDGQAHAVKPLHWDEFLKVLERAGFRNRDMVSSRTTILYTYALWIIGRVDFKVPVDELREVMARWYFMAAITGRYTNSPETRMQEDLNRLAGLTLDAKSFTAGLNAQIDAAVPADWWNVTLVDYLVTSSATAPVYLAYMAALNILDADVLLATSKVKDWISPQRRSVKGIEKHHLFPKDYLEAKLGIKDVRRTNQVANFALVEWSDNIDISNKAPEVYWPEQIADKRLEGNRLTRQEGWHALPPDWATAEYNEFLVRRRRLIAKVIREGFQQLSDPNYVPDLSTEDQLRAEPIDLPSFEELVISGIIPAGTVLTAADADISVDAEVLDDGYIKVGDHTYEDLDRAAHAAGADASSGWTFWEVQLSDDGDPRPLADIRSQVISAASLAAAASDT